MVDSNKSEQNRGNGTGRKYWKRKEKLKINEQK